MEDVEKLKLLRAEKLSTRIIVIIIVTIGQVYDLLNTQCSTPYSIIYIYEDLKIKHCKTLIGAVGI